MQSKGLLRVATIALGAMTFAMMIGCTGPEGPAGADGQNGVDGQNGLDNTANITCTQCHTHDQTITAKQREWEQSGHGVIEEGNSFDVEGGRGGCLPCHNGSVYPGWIAGNHDTLDYTYEMTNPIGPNCRTCHQIHTDYDTTDWELDTNAVKEVDLAAFRGTMADMGKGNICVNCHQARGVSNIDTMTADSAKMFQRTQAHHGPQAEIVLGMGGYEFTGITVSTAKPTVAAHAAVTDGCVGCHVSKLAGMNHTFAPSGKSCATTGCHTTTTFNVNSVQTQVAALQAEIIDSLVARNMLTIDSTALIGVSVSTANRAANNRKELVGAAYNLIVTLEDGSKGAHNGTYVKYLLKNALEVLQQ